MSDDGNESTKNDVATTSICAYCKNAAKQKCSGCNIVHYCSSEHQKFDWKKHSIVCRPYKLVENSQYGRFYIATRKIKADEIVIRKESPLLISPFFEASLMCLSCYVTLTNCNTRPCDTCGWPLCLDCKEHGPECQLTIKYRGSKVSINDSKMSSPLLHYCVMILRVIAMRDNKPCVYERFMSLESHYNNVMDAILDPLVPSGIAPSVKHYMRIDDLEVNDIRKIIGIVRINSFKSPIDEVIVLYDKLSYVMHDCIPNCKINTDLINRNDFYLETIRIISKGEPLTIAYYTPLENTIQRRFHLNQTKRFECRCNRCNDPTELGTMFSAVKCSKKDCKGNMLPSTFVVPINERIPDFKCDKCNSATPSVNIVRMIQQISEEYSMIDKNSAIELKKFIKNCAKILHENHSCIVNAELELAEILRKDDHTSPFDEYSEENFVLFSKLNNLLTIIAPAEYGERSTNLFSMLYEMRKREIIRGKGKSFEFKKFSKDALIEIRRLKCHDSQNYPTRDDFEIIERLLKDM